MTDPVSNVPDFKQLVPGGHGFALDSRGEIDDWRLDEGFHNGPRCVFCLEAWCEHCGSEHLVEACGDAPILLTETGPRKELES